MKSGEEWRVSELLRELVGKEVSISPFGSSLVIVQAISGGWLRLGPEMDPLRSQTADTPGSGSRLIPLRIIRLIKCLGYGMTAQSAAGGLAPELIGSSVEVQSHMGGSYYKDGGILEAFDESWLRVRASKAQLLFGVDSVIQLQVR